MKLLSPRPSRRSSPLPLRPRCYRRRWPTWPPLSASTFTLPQGPEIELRPSTVAQAAGIGWVRIDFIWACGRAGPGPVRLVGSTTRIAAAARGPRASRSSPPSPTLRPGRPPARPSPACPGRSGPVGATSASAPPSRYRGTIHALGAVERAQPAKLLVREPPAVHRRHPEARGRRDPRRQSRTPGSAGPDLAHLTAGDADWYDWLLADPARHAGDKLDFVTHHVYDERRPPRRGRQARRLAPSSAAGRRSGTRSTPSVEEVLKEAGRARTSPSGSPRPAGVAAWARPSRPPGTAAAERLVHRESGPQLDRQDLLLRADGRSAARPGLGHPAGGPQPQAGLRRLPRLHCGAHGAARRCRAGQRHLPRHHGGRPAGGRAPHLPQHRDEPRDARRGYRLGATDDVDPFTEPRQLLAAGEHRAGPGEDLRLRDHRSGVPGTYRIGWQMLREGLDRFGTPFSKQIQVIRAPSVEQRTLRLMETSSASRSAGAIPAAAAPASATPCPGST